jgi:hypothetical protein
MSVKVDTVFSLAIETTGFSHECDRSTGHQMVSVGLIAADAEDFKVRDGIHFTIKWNGESDWTEEAQRIHKLDKDSGDLTEEEAAAQIANFFIKHNELEPIVLLGHNIESFGYYFIRSILDKYGLSEIIISTRSMDTFTLGKTLYGLDSQKQMFNFLRVGVPKHTLDKSKAYLKLFRITKKLWSEVYEK